MKKGKEIFLTDCYTAPRATSVEFTNEGFLLSASEPEVLLEEYDLLYFDGEEPNPDDPDIIIF